MALWELLAPRRRQDVGRGRRWPSNLGIVAVDTRLVRLVFPTAAAYLLAQWALAHVDSSVVAFFIYLQPLIATSLSRAML